MKYFLEVVVIATGLGILWRSFFDFGLTFILLFCIIAVVLLVVLRQKGALIAIALFAFSLGMLRVDMHIASVEMTRPLYAEGVYEGVIVDEPDKRDASLHLVVQYEDTKVRVTVPLSHTLLYGDRVRLTGEIEQPSSFTTDNGRDFAYDAWLLKDGITGVMLFPKVEKLGSGEGNVIKHFLFNQKRRFLEALAAIIPEPNMSLLGGLVVGAKQAMGETLLEQFRITGLIHIVVLSGYNVSIIADWLLRALGFLPVFLSTFVGGVVIILFAILTGGSATIIRASIMALIVLLSRVVSRPYDIMRALLVAGMVMVVWNPLILAFDPSFQLSFLATFGLITIAPIIERRLKNTPKMFGIREVLVATFATQLFVLPHLIWFSGTVSIIAPVANVLVLLFVPYTMALGFVTGVLALVLPGFLSVVSVLPGILTGILLSYQLFVVSTLASLPFASVSIPQFSYLYVVMLYASMFGVYRYMNARKRSATVSKFIA